MTLTIEEKEHWKERISRKIDLAIETLCDEHDPNILVRVGWRADRLALESLDIVETHTRLHEIKVAKEALDREENTLLRKLGAELRILDCPSHDSCGLRNAIENMIQTRQRLHEKDLLAAEPLGRRILELRLEQENLLDTVWLATSEAQIKQLWSQVNEMLHQQPTNLQQHVLSLDPVPHNPT